MNNFNRKNMEVDKMGEILQAIFVHTVQGV